jgi:2-polyprenyl-3-methyl-5-hydroxy-6-metoxy-1,4-benzoquinol methylase
MESIKRMILRFDQRRRFFRSLAGATRLLDVGCGKGKNASEIHSMFPTLEIHGVDRIHPSMVPAFVQFKQVDVDKQPLPYPDSSFDAVVLAHVLEHLEKPLLLGPEIHRILRPEGRVYIETPNWTSLFIPSFAVRREQLQTINFFDDHTHRKAWSKQGIYEYLTLCCGLQAERVGTVRNWLRLPVDPLVILAGVFAPNRGIVASAIWNLTSWRIYGVGRKSTRTESKPRV